MLIWPWHSVAVCPRRFVIDLRSWQHLSLCFFQAFLSIKFTPTTLRKCNLDYLYSEVPYGQTRLAIYAVTK